MSKKKKKPVVVDENIADKVETIEIESNAISSDEEESAEDESPEEETVELDPIKILEKDLQKTKDELAEEKDKFVRLQAETDNFRKRLSREKEEFSQYANERLFKELLPIFDNFERALDDSSNDIKSLKEGLEMILKQFSSFLEITTCDGLRTLLLIVYPLTNWLMIVFSSCSLDSSLVKTS